MADTVPVIRRPDHKFQPGKSGNPAGRPKGSKNAVTLLRLAIEGELRQQMKNEMPEVLSKAIGMAKEGNEAMIKMLMEMWVPRSRASDDDAPAKEKVQIVIGRLDQEPPQVVGRIIDADK